MGDETLVNEIHVVKSTSIKRRMRLRAVLYAFKSQLR